MFEMMNLSLTELCDIIMILPLLLRQALLASAHGLREGYRICEERPREHEDAPDHEDRL